MAGSRPNPQTWFLLFALLTTLAWPAGAQPAPIVQGSYTVAGLQLVPSNNTWRNNMQGELSLPFQSSPVPMTFQLSPDGGKVVSGFITASFPIQVKGFTFTLQDSIYDAQHDRFVADAVLTGPELPERLLAKRVVWDRTGILEVGELTSKYWNLAHELWQIGQGELTPEGLVWKDGGIEVQGLFIQGIFHAQVAARVEQGRVVSVSLLKPAVLLHESRVVTITALRQKGLGLVVDGQTGLPDGSTWRFKNAPLTAEGKLEIQFPIRKNQAAAAAVREARAQLAALPGVEELLEAVSGSGPPAGPGPAPPTALPASRAREGLRDLPQAPEGSAPPTALLLAQAQGMEILPVQGAPNLSMVVTQSSGNQVDGFIPLMDWVGPANVYGATRSGGQVSVDQASMSWQRKTVQPPASGFPVCTLQDPVTYNPVTGRLSSGLVGTPSFRGFSASLSDWEVDTREFRMRAGTFAMLNAKANPMGPGALFQASLTGPYEGISVQGAPSIPPDVKMPDRSGPINIPFQGGLEFDIVFLQGGDWGFELRTALPQLDMGGPDWLRSGVAWAPRDSQGKPIVFPTIFLKVYNSGYVYFNLVAQGVSIPLGDSGLSLTNPGLLFGYEPVTGLFFMEVTTQVTIDGVNPNIFAARGTLYIDGSGMGKSGGGEVQLAGYVLDVNVGEFDAGFGKTGDEWAFALTIPTFQILGFNLEASGEFKVPPPPDNSDWAGAVSGFIRIPILGKVGATFYGYIHPFKITFKFGGTEFHIAGGESGSPSYQGDFQVAGINWYGTETIDTSKGAVNVSGKSKIQGTSSDNSSVTASWSFQNGVLSEEGVAQGSIASTAFQITLKPQGASVSVTDQTPTFTLDASNSRFYDKISGVPVTIGKWSGKADLELSLSYSGILTATLDLPDSQGGPYTQQFNLTSTPDQSS